jgi:hypothetical protein
LFSLLSRQREEREQKLYRKLETTMDEKLHYSSFGWECSFVIFCAQHLFRVQNYAGKLRKTSWLTTALITTMSYMVAALQRTSLA